MNNSYQSYSTYILESLPELVATWSEEYVKDTFMPPQSRRPALCLRQKGDELLLIKNSVHTEGGVSTSSEEIINLVAFEYKFFDDHLPGNVLEKTVYTEDFDAYVIEIEEYMGSHAPLIIMKIYWRNKKLALNLSQYNVYKEVTNPQLVHLHSLLNNSYDDLIHSIDG